MQRRTLGMERGLDDPAARLAETDPDHAPVGSASKGAHQPTPLELVNHQRDACLRSLDELGEVPLHAPFGSSGAGLKEQVVLERAQVVQRERSIDLDHRLPEAAAEHRGEAQVVDRGVLEEVVGLGFRLCFRC